LPEDGEEDRKESDKTMAVENVIFKPEDESEM